MFKPRSIERHPFGSLLLLLSLFFACAVLFGILAFVAAILIYDIDSITLLSNSTTALNIESLRLIQIISSFGMFVIASIFFAKLESPDWINYLGFKKVKLPLILLTIFIMLSMSPVMEFINELNKKMVFPATLKDIELWMRVKEQQMEEATKQFLIMNNASVFMINMLMLAIIPGIGEELIFRACLQKIFTRWTNNYHLAIWITAIIFSAIHFQFYGFIPRMLLGALFGYLLVWSGSIWLPIMAHFLNNAMAVVGAYVLQQQGKSIDEAFVSDPINMPLIISSTIAFSFLIWYFHSYTIKLKKLI